MEKLTIGKLARQCDVTIDTIRYYEHTKLIQAQERSKAGYRLYAPESMRRLAFIRRCKELGFTLDEIRKLLSLTSTKDTTCAEMLKRTHDKITKAQDRIKDLSRIEAALTQLARAHSGDMPAGKCHILDYLHPESFNRQPTRFL